jgi:hypothetical protein
VPKRVGQNCPGSFAQVAGEAARKKGLSVKWLGECNLPGGGSKLSHSPPHPRSADGHPPPRGGSVSRSLAFQTRLGVWEFAGTARLGLRRLDATLWLPSYALPSLRSRSPSFRTGLIEPSFSMWHPASTAENAGRDAPQGGIKPPSPAQRGLRSGARTPWLACGEQAEFCLSKTGKLCATVLCRNLTKKRCGPRSTS